MKIKLTRTGGFIPVTKTAETETGMSEKELSSLIDLIKHDTKAYRIKDGNYYELSVGNKSIPVDIEKVPDQYKELFTKLKAEMKIKK